MWSGAAILLLGMIAGGIIVVLIGGAFQGGYQQGLEQLAQKKQGKPNDVDVN